jgi:hypothetical protein
MHLPHIAWMYFQKKEKKILYPRSNSLACEQKFSVIKKNLIYTLIIYIQQLTCVC